MGCPAARAAAGDRIPRLLAVAGAVVPAGARDADGERGGARQVKRVVVDVADGAVEADGLVGEGERQGHGVVDPCARPHLVHPG